MRAHQHTKEIDLAASGWVYRNKMFNTDSPSLPFAPALATHNGRMWCLFVKRSDGKLYFAQGTNDRWEEPKPFKDGDGNDVGTSTTPALVDLDGVLHAVFVENIDNSHDLVHYQYDDVSGRWGKRYGLAQHSTLPPTLATFDGELFCAFVADVKDNTLLYAIWNSYRGWTPQRGTDEHSWGAPALVELDGNLHLLFAERNDGRKILDLQYDPPTKTWSRTSRPPESTAGGLSAASIAPRGFLGFLENSNSGSVLVSAYDKGWRSHEQVTQKSYDTPALTVFNGVLNCAFISANDNRDLLWSQRPVIDVSLTSWMSRVNGATNLSALSIPGTHDSCAVSIVPFVSTQTMSILDQLNAGIRFLDLRCGLEYDELYMFHGSYALNMSLDDVLQDVYKWLDDHKSETVIAMIKEEKEPIDSTVKFPDAIRAKIKEKPGYWYQNTDSPTLDLVRGKMVLMHRYEDPLATVGIDVSSWDDNSARFDMKTKSGVELTVQDHYDLTQGSTLADRIDEKWKAVLPLLDEAASGPKSRWYLNYSSGVSQGNGYLAVPRVIALGSQDLWIYTPGVNATLSVEIAERSRTGRYGLVIMDYPESPASLISTIVQSNQFTSSRQGGPRRHC